MDYSFRTQDADNPVERGQLFKNYPNAIFKKYLENVQNSMET